MELSSEFFVQVYCHIASLLLGHCYIGPLAMVSNLYRLAVSLCIPSFAQLVNYDNTEKHNDSMCKLNL